MTQSVLAEMGDDDLNRLSEELEQIAFGGNTSARDAAKRQALETSGVQQPDRGFNRTDQVAAELP